MGFNVKVRTLVLSDGISVVKTVIVYRIPIPDTAKFSVMVVDLWMNIISTSNGRHVLPQCFSLSDDVTIWVEMELPFETLGARDDIAEWFLWNMHNFGGKAAS